MSIMDDQFSDFTCLLTGEDRLKFLATREINGIELEHNDTMAIGINMDDFETLLPGKVPSYILISFNVNGCDLIHKNEESAFYAPEIRPYGKNAGVKVRDMNFFKANVAFFWYGEGELGSLSVRERVEVYIKTIWCKSMGLIYDKEHLGEEILRRIQEANRTVNIYRKRLIDPINEEIFNEEYRSYISLYDVGRRPGWNEWNEWYDAYLKSDHWVYFKTNAYNFFRNKCCLCGSENNLNLHHKNYNCLGRETFDDVVLLCSECHRTHHRK